MKRELADIKTVVQVLKGDVHVLKEDIRGLKTDVQDVKAQQRRAAAALVNVVERLESVPTTAMMKDMFGAMMARMDGFAKLLEDSRYRWTVHADTLLDHDRRLKQLESRG